MPSAPENGVQNLQLELPPPSSCEVSSLGADGIVYGVLCFELTSLGSTDSICFGKESNTLFSIYSLFYLEIKVIKHFYFYLLLLLFIQGQVVRHKCLPGLASVSGGVPLETQQLPQPSSAPSCRPGLYTLPGSQALPGRAAQSRRLIGLTSFSSFRKAQGCPGDPSKNADLGAL